MSKENLVYQPYAYFCENVLPALTESLFDESIDVGEKY
jgi:hypothetical protein